MDFAYATLKHAGIGAMGQWAAVPMGHETGWLVSNPKDIPVEKAGQVVMIRYVPQDQFCRVVTPMDVEDAVCKAHDSGLYHAVCNNHQVCWPGGAASIGRWRTRPSAERNEM